MIPRLWRLRLAIWRCRLEVVQRTGKGNDEVKSDKPERISVRSARDKENTKTYMSPSI